AAIVAALALAHAWPGGGARRWRIALGVAAGALGCVSVLMLYNQAAFGAPLALGYGHVEGFAGMQRGLLGITYPKLNVLRALLIGRYRGLLLLAPVLALAPWGFALLVRATGTRVVGAAATA